MMEQIFDESQTNTPKKFAKTRKVLGSHGALDNLVSHLFFACELLATEAV